MILKQASFIETSENVVLLDIRNDMQDKEKSIAEYQKEHIASAVHISLDELCSEITLKKGRHPLRDLDEFISLMEEKGVSDKSTIIIYDNGETNMAARLWFMLQLISLDSYIIEGGFQKIKDSKFKTESGVHKNKKGKITKKINTSMLVDLDEFLELIKDNKYQIIDSRSQARYEGLEEPFDQIAGHIPNSVNYFWKDNFDSSFNALETKKLEKRFSKLDIEKECICYCGSGITGAVNTFFLKHLGFKARLFAGSYSQYVSNGYDVITKNGELRNISNIDN